MKIISVGERKDKPVAYLLSYEDLVSLVQSPLFFENKHDNAWLLPCPLPYDVMHSRKAVADQSFYAVVLDFDKGEGFDRVQHLLQCAGIADYVAWSSASSTGDYPKIKVVARLLQPTNAVGYEYLQRILCERMGSDEAMQSPSQITYLPAITPVNQSSYAWRCVTGDMIAPDHSLFAAARQLYRQDQERKAASHKAREKRIASTVVGSIDPVCFINDSLTVEDALEERGYTRESKGRYKDGSRERSFITVGKNGWGYCKTPNHHMYNGGRGFRAFDVIRLHDHGGDFRAAVRWVADNYTTTGGQTITAHNRAVYLDNR